jgi:ribonuclease P protein component
MSSRAAKVSITVDPTILRDVKKLARRAGVSLSAQISEAVGRDLRRRRLQELIAEHEARRGPISDVELQKIRAAWRD